MQLGERTAAWGGGLSAKSYGGNIVYQLDGIENDGYGVHVATGKWRDLISLTQGATSATFAEDALIITANESGARVISFPCSAALQSAVASGEYTLEVGFKAKPPTNNSNRYVFQGYQKFAGIGLFETTTFAMCGNANHYRSLANYTVDADGRYSMAWAFTVKDGSTTWMSLESAYSESATAEAATVTLMRTYYQSDADNYLRYVRVHAGAISEQQIAYNYAIDKARFGLT